MKTFLTRLALRLLHLGLLPLGLLSLGSAPALAADCDTAIVLPERPLLEHYTDYSAFIVDIMQFKRIEDEKLRHREACPDTYLEAAQSPPASTPSLSDAVAQADSRTPFDYQRHSTWHGRSTSRSFPMANLDNQTLASSRLLTQLADTPRPLPRSTYVLLPADWRGDDLERRLAQLDEANRERATQARWEQTQDPRALPLAFDQRGNIRMLIDGNGAVLGIWSNIYACSDCNR
ncbi:hypothetical protein [Isoalcanivorax indicus]|uniref:hypothetical protein n=1 Tax=Isoalcanivorax indicus TaxID=2202653 RepID=UPI0013C4392B|nr:hypothetical protein [Isoalcanivorax indicus]